MNVCKDCIHYEICDKWVSPCESFPETEGCKCFKDKSYFVELPCKVGDKVYKPIITSKGEPAIWEIIVTSIDIDIGKNGVSPNSYVIGHLKNTHCGESAYFCEFGKTVFLTREEAEQALERREDEQRGN